tara:strand:+ start:39 stop:563 length:525 start_codon:yes stop_codon:yes gene_type:complete
MGKRIGKFKLSKREQALSLVDGGDVEGRLSFTQGFFLPNSSPATDDLTHTLSDSDSGKVVFLDASGGATKITLPAISTVSAGWNVKVILTATGAAGTVVTSGLEDKFVGQVLKVDNDGSAIAMQSDADADTITFLNNCSPGSMVTITSNGSLFYVDGVGHHATTSNKLTLTKED